VKVEKKDNTAIIGFDRKLSKEEMQELEIRGHFLFLTSHTTLARGFSLLMLSESPAVPEELMFPKAERELIGKPTEEGLWSITKEALLGSAIILFGSTLDQATKNRYIHYSHEYAGKFDTGWAHSPTWKFLDRKNPHSCLINRILALPEYISEGKYRINEKCQEVHDLIDMIKLRNSIVHIDDEFLANLHDPRVIEITGEHVVINIEDTGGPWTHITTEMARTYYHATKQYFDEVMNPDDEEAFSGSRMIKPFGTHELSYRDIVKKHLHDRDSRKV